MKMLDEDENKSSQDISKAQMYAGSNNANMGMQQSQPAATPNETLPKMENVPSGDKESFLAGTTSTPSVDESKAQMYNTTPATDETSTAEAQTALTPEQKLANTQVATEVTPPQLSVDAIKAMTEPKRKLTEREEEILSRKGKRDALIGAIGDGMSALANMYFASQGAISTHDPSKDLSVRAKKRWEDVIAKRNAEMEANYLRYQDAKKNKEDRTLKERELELRAEANKNEALRLAQQAQNYGFNQDQKTWERGFKETQEKNRVRNNANKDAIAWARIANAKGKIPFTLDGGSTIEVDASYLRDKTYISNIFSKLPKEIRDKVGKPKKDMYGNETGEHYPPTADEMRAAIGENIDMVKEYLENTPKVQETTASAATQPAQKKPSPTATTTKKPSPTATTKKPSPTK